MTTTPAAKEETLEQIAERIANTIPQRAKQAFGREQVKDDVLSALHNRDGRAVRLIDEHQAMDVCNDNCWTTIKAAIRGRTE